MPDEPGVKTKEAPAAGEPNQSEPQTQAPAGDEQMIPKERLDQVIGQRNDLENAKSDLEAQNEVFKQQLAILQANAPVPQTNPQANQKGTDYIGSEVADTDFANKEQINEALQQMHQTFSTVIANQQFQLSHPDFNEIVGSREQMAPALTKYLTDNPATAAQIQNHPQPVAFLYALGKTAANAEKAKAKTKKDKEKDEPENKGDSTPPASPSALGSGKGNYSAAGKFNKMSAEEFEADVARVKAGG